MNQVQPLSTVPDRRLSDLEQRIWRHFAPKAVKKGALQCDSIAFETLCRAWAHYAEESANGEADHFDEVVQTLSDKFFLSPILPAEVLNGTQPNPE